MIPDFSIENNFLKDGKNHIAGVDEVGRGSLAGPIVAAAVVFEKYDQIINKLEGVTDSKKLTAGKRQELDVIIRETASDYAIAEISVDIIDQYGIGAANIMAFEKALQGLKKCDLALIDGKKFKGFTFDYYCFEKGESKSLSIAAASIIAKVYRDNLMTKLIKSYPGYDFESNKGYGSASHWKAIEANGLTKIHRKTFVHLPNGQNSLFDL